MKNKTIKSMTIQLLKSKIFNALLLIYLGLSISCTDNDYVYHIDKEIGKNIDLTEEYYLNILEKYPNSLYIKSMIAYYYFSSGYEQEGVNFLKKNNLLETDSENTFINTVKAVAFYYLGDSLKADDLLKTALYQDKKGINKWVHFELFLFYEHNDFDKSIYHLEQAIEIDSDFFDPKISYIEYVSLHNIKCNDFTLRSIELCHSLLKQGFHINDIYSLLSLSYTRCNYPLSGIEYGYKSLETAYSTQGLLVLANAYFKKSDFTKADQLYREAIDNEDTVDVWAQYFLSLLRRNDFDRAKLVIDEMISKFGNTFFTDGYYTVYEILTRTDEPHDKIIEEFVNQYGEDSIEWIDYIVIEQVIAYDESFQEKLRMSR